jgi:hypothetical protein
MSEQTPETRDGPLEDPDLPDSTQNDAPDAPGVEHGSEENPDPQEVKGDPEPGAEGEGEAE